SHAEPADTGTGEAAFLDRQGTDETDEREIALPTRNLVDNGDRTRRPIRKMDGHDHFVGLQRRRIGTEKIIGGVYVARSSYRSRLDPGAKRQSDGRIFGRRLCQAERSANSAAIAGLV